MMTIIQKIDQVRNAGPEENTKELIADVLQSIYEAIPTSLPASDVYPWAKQPLKPSYMANEVGAEPAGHNIDVSSHQDIRQLLNNNLIIKSISIDGVPISVDISGNVNIERNALE